MDNEIQTITTLHDLLDFDARKFSISEMQVNQVLPVWIGKANALKLKTVLQRYNDLIQKNIEKLEAFIAEENINSLSFINKVMSALIDETESKLASCGDPEVKDACLLACVQSINHYKISMYGTASAFAKILGKEKAAILFHEAEAGEKQIDDRLSQLAEHEINDKAKSPIVLPA